MNTDIRDVARGEAITAAKTNQGNGILRSVRSILGGPGVYVSQTEESGTTIAVEDKGSYAGSFIVQLVSAGPNGEADWMDARYWGQVTLVPAANPNDAIKIQAETLDLYDIPTDGGTVQASAKLQTMVVTNLDELYTSSSINPLPSTHTLRTDGSICVRVFPVQDRDDPPNFHYVFSKRPSGWFILTGTATRPGMYTAKCLVCATSPIDPSLSSNLAQSDLGTQGSQSVYLLNTREVAVSGHALSSSTVPNVIHGTYWGLAKDGLPIFVTDECQ